MMNDAGHSPHHSYLAADFFCGAGGLSLGLQWAGFQPAFAFDSDPYACQTYRHNLGEHLLRANATTLSVDEIYSSSGLGPGSFTLVCGGPPCQGFSIQRRGQRQDIRNDLVIDFARLAVELHPPIILIENVPQLLGRRGRAYLREVIAYFEGAGYQCDAQVLDAADFGVSQHRLRAFVVARRPDQTSPFVFPRATHDRANRRTVRDAIANLPEPPLDYSEAPGYPNHTRVRITPLNELRIAHVPPGGGRADLPVELQLPCHKNDNGHRHLDVYGRMEWDKPAPTITAMFDSFTRGRFAHPEQNRPITGREGARLQSFPDTFRFYGPKKDVARQIGNAVPPLLACAIGEALRASLDQEARREDSIRQLSLPLSIDETRRGSGTRQSESTTTAAY
jgi:DNA (cytosine-5)-methyltransferase 1